LVEGGEAMAGPLEVSVVESPPQYELHTPWHTTLATIIGGPIAGGLVIYWNFRKVGDAAAGKLWLYIGVGIMAVVVAAGLLFPFSSGMGLAIGGVVAMHHLAKQALGRMLEAHKRRGGKLASAWHAAGLGLVCLVVLMGSVFMSSAITGRPLWFLADYGELISFGNDEVYYTEGVTEEKARAFGAFLQEFGYFIGAGASAQIRKEDGVYVLAFVLQDGAWNELVVVMGFEELQESASKGFLMGYPFEVHLCDETFTTQHVLE